MKPEETNYGDNAFLIDHTLADMFIVSKDGELIGRPWITTIIDPPSDCIVENQTDSEPPSSGSNSES